MRTDGRALVEATLSLDIRPLVRAGVIRDDVHADGEMKLRGGGDGDGGLTIAFKVSTRDSAKCWLRLRYTIVKRGSGGRSDLDDEISLTTSRAGFAGRRWLFVCPALGLPVRALYLPDGARYFRSRQFYDLAYETEHLDDRERAWRRVRKCRRLLSSDPDGIGHPFPPRPPRMPLARYAVLLDRLDAAENDLDLPLTLGGAAVCLPPRPGAGTMTPPAALAAAGSNGPLATSMLSGRAARSLLEGQRRPSQTRRDYDPR